MSKRSHDSKKLSPPPKRAKESNAKAPPNAEIDPNELGDVLNAAGVDLREEESLLNSQLNEQGGIAGARLLHAPKHNQLDAMLLNSTNLKKLVSQIASENGLKIDDISTHSNTNNNNLNSDPFSLICASCEEWLSVILQEAAAYSRHRRLSRNPTSLSQQSEVSNALREIMHQDKAKDSTHEVVKDKLGLTQETPVDEKETEERTQRAANDTARMMTANIGRKKKFSWMSNSEPAPQQRSQQTRRGATDPTKFKEVREDHGIVMRDLLPALERKHMGVKRALVKGYARLRN